VKKRADPATEQRALGRRVAELRRESGRTQSAVAERAGVTVRYVQAVEAGDYNPTFSTLLALARGLEVAPVELFVPPMSTEPAPRGRPPGVTETERRRRVSPTGSARRPTGRKAR
jgi:transcriptional regulator with XRE-family HTH domain